MEKKVIFGNLTCDPYTTMLRLSVEDLQPR
jgi:hypothetical protein